MKALSASALASSVFVPVTRPGPGSGTASSTVRTTGSMPAFRSWIGSLLAKPVAASTWPCWSAAACAEVRELHDGHVVHVSPASESSAWSMIQLVPYRPGMPIRFPRRSAAVAIPAPAFAMTTAGNVP